MSSRHRRMQTLKYFDKHYRRGQRQSANTGTDKPETTPISTTEDTQTGYEQCQTGIPEAPNSGRVLNSSLNQRSWEEAMERMVSQLDQWQEVSRGWWVIPTMGRLEGAVVSAQEAPGAEEHPFNQIQGSLSEWSRMRRIRIAERERAERERNRPLLYQAMSTPGLAIHQDHANRTYTFTINGTTHVIPMT